MAVVRCAIWWCFARFGSTLEAVEMMLFGESCSSLGRGVEKAGMIFVKGRQENMLFVT